MNFRIVSCVNRKFFFKKPLLIPNSPKFFLIRINLITKFGFYCETFSTTKDGLPLHSNADQGTSVYSIDVIKHGSHLSVSSGPDFV